MSVRLNYLLGTRYYEQILRLPQSYFDDEQTGKISNRLSRGIGSITRFVQMMTNNFASMFLTIGFSILYIGYYSPIVAVMITLLIPLYFVLTRSTSQKWQEYEKEINSHNDTAVGRFTEVIGQVRVVKSFNQQKREWAHFEEHYEKTIGISKKQSTLWHVEDVKRKSMLNFLFFVMTAVIIWQASKGQISPGRITTFLFMLNGISFPISNMSFILENAQRAIAGSADYMDVMELPVERDMVQLSTSENYKPASLKKSSIRFEDVNFRYGDVAVLRNVTFSAKQGSKVALVGESGQGKTTISQLLMGLYEIESGSIKIGDQDIKDLNLAALREHIAVVFQEPYLFSGSIFENISYARPTASENDVVAAAKAAGIHDFILTLPEAYRSTIGERGVKLSGGQKQRISIARALLKDSPILILDEATSSLDSKSEREVQNALDVLMEGRTSIIIAHRLSTIDKVDSIVTIKDGTVDEIGSPKELSLTQGVYATLLALQRGSTPKDKKTALSKYDINV
jgi:ATP-binding cassette, subfamily B, bacterial